MKNIYLIIAMMGFIIQSSAQQLQVTSGANIKTSGNAFIILDNMNVVNNGSFVQAAGDGTTRLTGNTNITTSGTGVTTLDKLDVAIDNGFSNTLSTTVSLKNVITLTTGQLVSNGFLTIKSDINNTAIVAPITSTIIPAIAGDVIVERYISSLNNRAYRLLGPSVNSGTSIHVNWQENATSRTNNPNPGFGTHITGTMVDQTNGFDATITGQGSLFTYNQVTPAWIAAANTDISTLDGKTGYLIYVRGDRSMDLDAPQNALPSSNTTLRATGSLLMGTQSFAGLPVNDFDLVTNPYASAINWASIYTNNSAGFSNYYTYWDPNIGSRGAYVTVTDGGVTSPAASGTVNIQSGQAFFVRSTTGTTLNILETDKSSTNNIDVFRVTSAAQKFTTALYYNDPEHGRRLADGVTALYDNSYNASLDGNDAIEINNWDENIAIARQGKHLSIEERPIITTSDSLPLFMNNMKQQGYEFEFNPTNLNPNTAARLVDKFTGTSTVLNVTATTVVPFTVTANAASSATDRFYVLFSPSGALPISLTSVKAYQKNTAVQVEWTTQQENNMDRYEVEKSQNVQLFTKIGSVVANNSGIVSNYTLADANPFTGANYYRIKIIDKSAQVTYSQVVKVSIGSGPAQVTASPNPVNGNTITLQLTNLQKGSYTVSLINKLGQTIQSKVIDHPGGSATQTIPLSKVMTTGVYQLKVAGTANTITLQVIKN